MKNVLLIIYCVVVISCSNNNNLAKTNNYIISLSKDYSPVSISTHPRDINQWYVYRDAYYPHDNAAFVINSYLNKDRSKQLYLEDAYLFEIGNDSIFEKVKVNINGLPGYFINGISNVLTEDNNVIKYYYSKWIIDGSDQIYSLEIGAYSRELYYKELNNAKAMVSTFKPLKVSNDNNTL